MPKTPSELLLYLDGLGIATTTVEHAAVFTVEQAKAVRGELGGAHVKNLFLRNKKGRMWLVTLPEDRVVDLKDLARRLGAGHLSFASAERLMEHLGVEPGAVTPFGIIHADPTAVTFVLDAALAGAGVIHCHPLVNTMTTAIEAADLLRFIRSCAHEPRVLELREP